MRNSIERTGRILPALVLAAAAACGGKEPAPVQTEPVAPTPPPQVTVFTDTKGVCEERRDACQDQALRAVEACANRAERAALSQCIGEAITCFGAAETAYSTCNDREQDCLQMGTDEIRACVRGCRTEFLRSQTTCTSSQSAGLRGCNERRRTEEGRCQRVEEDTFTRCIDPADDTRVVCDGNAQLAFLNCLNGISNMIDRCRSECQTQTCRDMCDTREVIEQRERLRCETEQRLARDACDDSYDSARSACRSQADAAGTMCRGAIPLEVYSCEDDVLLANQLCIERAINREDDCQRGCDPLGARRCDFDCSETYYQTANNCFRDEWSCYADRSNEGSATCETQATAKVDMCFADAKMCEAENGM